MTTTPSSSRRDNRLVLGTIDARPHRKIHYGDEPTPYGHFLLCPTSSGAKRLTHLLGEVTRRTDTGATFAEAVLAELNRIDRAPDRLCLRCFPATLRHAYEQAWRERHSATAPQPPASVPSTEPKPVPAVLGYSLDTRTAPKLVPTVLGYTFDIRTGQPSAPPVLHRGSTQGDQHGLDPHCNPHGDERILRAEATVAAQDHEATPYDDALITALIGLDVPPASLCATCFHDDLILDAYRWEHTTAHTTRTVTVSADAAALIAYAVAFSQDRATARHAPSPGTSAGPHTVTLSGHADAVITGLVAPADEGDTDATPDQVWHQGIYALDSTWREIHTAFPLSLYEQRDLTHADHEQLWREIQQQAFPLTTFLTWAEQSARYVGTAPDSSGYDYEYSLTGHRYDPEAGT